MYRFLLTRRWLALHLVVLLAIPAFVLLGRWQYGRFEEESAAAGLTERNIAAPAVPLDTLSAAGGKVPADRRYRAVTVAGRYDAGHELLVRRRIQHSEVGFYVVTPLITTDGSAVLVNRGWLKAPASATDVPDVPPPPDGQVTVTGRLELSETEESSGITDRGGQQEGQVLLIDVPVIGERLPYTLHGGYVELVEQRPRPGEAPEPVPAPDVGGGGGLNLAYAFQWWLFIGIAIGGWFFLIRKEARERHKTPEAVPH